MKLRPDADMSLIKQTTTRKAGENLARILDGHILKWGVDYAKANHGRAMNIEVVAEACCMVLENVVAMRPDLASLIIENMHKMKFVTETLIRKDMGKAN